MTTTDALIFDCDGLLVDTETPDFTSWAAIFADHGAELRPERWMRGLGTFGAFDPLAELEALTGRRPGEDVLDEQRRRYLETCAAQPLLPGVRELLDAGRAAGLRIALASSSERAWVQAIVDRHHLGPLFDCIRTRDDVARIKPAPDLFLSAAGCLGVAPERCVVLEDSPHGMRAAEAAGMRCVAVPIGMLAEAELPPHTLRLRSLADHPPETLLRLLNGAAKAP